MTPKNKRTLLKEFEKLAKTHGISMAVDTRRGKGDHVFIKLTWTSESGGEIGFPLDGKKEVSAGAQRTIRKIVHQVMERSSDRATQELARVVLEIIVKLVG